MTKAQTSANDELVLTIRKMILEYDRPFCTIDLKVYFKEANVGNDKLVLNVLENLYNEGLVRYGFIGKPGDEFCNKDSEGRSNYAFKVA